MNAPALPAGDRNSVLSPTERTRLIRALVDELIPGNETWPSASDAGVHGIIALRIFADWSEEQLGELAAAFGWNVEGLSSGEPARRIASVAAFEAADPELFEQIYTAVTLAYYETPFVIEAIRATGRPYSHRPHLTGYEMVPFDMARDRPTHGRGRYLTTGEVAAVDTSALDLKTVKTEKWGLAR